MEDIKMLCKRSVVVNHGRKIYDGETEELFERYQFYKKISFTEPDCFNFEFPDWCMPGGVIRFLICYLPLRK